ncbi:LuxR C-terminal-related transcriptional regulator [Ruegeria sp. 2012CJ41-6]|uniref:LuxR C-terminal-related transcriptional regulator n=1 Tax=Ruegeria spongiae TaxID=2942209 RepID=A0ABT0Q775_9RHOB|nr:LuxR C-terminal-related transcriptional regulator [Ruegeria spongiae]MCL6285695.1 LuxR C-terminal-related transcriptional regulator [Ruegeria spongiae]
MRISQSSLLWLLLVVQGACATFFLADAVMDWTGHDALGFRHLHRFEMFLALALIGGLAATIALIRAQGARARQMRRQIDVASGAFAEVITRQFDEWRLSAAERDVAMLSIKGLSVAEIAALRQTKEGTIKAQSAAVYKKAGVSGRLQLLSYFVEELLSDPLLDRSAR